MNNDITRPIVCYKLAIILRNLGIPQTSYKRYNANKEFSLQGRIGAPTYDEVVAWFRNRFGYHIFLRKVNGKWFYYVYNLDEKKYEVTKQTSPLYGVTYDKSLEAAIYFVIRFCKVRES